VVKAVLDRDRLRGGLGGGVALGLGLSLGEETSLLLLLGLGLVLVEELEELGGGVLVKGVRELSDRGGDLGRVRHENNRQIKLLLLTLRRWWRMTFWRWKRTYSGHLTKRVRSCLGAMSPPMPKVLGRASKRGFWAVFLATLVP
jgi:hypothetical protein